VRTAFLVILFVLVLVPSWTGDPRLPLYDGVPMVTFSRVSLDDNDPARTRVGALTYLGGIRLRSDDSAFGGFSAMHIAGERFTMLADGGLGYSFTMGRDLVPRAAQFWEVPDGPGTGWSRSDRDSESLAVDPANGRAWVGYEHANAIWRYAPGLTRAEAHRAPQGMRDWPLNGGAEALVRLRSGRFLVISESKGGRGGRMALAFDRDPTDRRARSFAFAYRPPAGYSPTDAAELPDGRLLVLNRAASLRDGFTAVLTLVDLRRRLRSGATLRGREIARFEAPVIHDNFEALAITREGDDAIVWIASDDNPPSLFQRSLLLKFRLELPPSR
jgi:hypothetical protein